MVGRRARQPRTPHGSVYDLNGSPEEHSVERPQRQRARKGICQGSCSPETIGNKTPGAKRSPEVVEITGDNGGDVALKTLQML